MNNNLKYQEMKEVKGEFVTIRGEKFYQIKNYDRMQAFFISLASDSNHWMYIASTGGLTAGRKNPDFALFPYYTDDKITESAEITGSKSIFNVQKNDSNHIWEPFSDRNKGMYVIERSIAKSTTGNKLIFTEKNIDLGLEFSYCWMNADDFGWIKQSKLTNLTDELVSIYVVDGLQNLLPAGIDRQTQNFYSTLVDGYKKTELVENTCFALFRMEAILVDRAEPSESLRANTVWSTGLDNADFLLSSKQLDDVRMGLKAYPEHESKGVRGAYFACSELTLKALGENEWYFVAEVNQDVTEVINRIEYIQNETNIVNKLLGSVDKGTLALRNIVAQADGVQETADENGMARHFANVLFNTMRGGIYSDNYAINGVFFQKHVRHFNVKTWEKHQHFLTSLPERIEYSELQKLVEAQHDANLYRLFLEYLPLTFSRRHGDPSRPWNAFNINIKDEHGEKLLSYQGNWRDIFQNWEALSLSYPAYINGIIAKFMNATTADGYNPYKITNDGIDWETIEPDNPWSNIGYWGDHQIIYLLKLLELSYNHYPEELQNKLNNETYAYANVPYRLKSYAEIVQNPKDSIRFDSKLHHEIEALEKTYGADARLLLNENQEVVLVSFTEKILSTLLAKLSNFIPEAGIWMNTLRPEWNDANNALVGNGASMVTLYYIRRFVTFMQKLYSHAGDTDFKVSQEIFVFFNQIFTALVGNKSVLQSGFDNKQRRILADSLGLAGEHYRNSVYAGFSNQNKQINNESLRAFLDLVLKFVDQSIAKNEREDHLYHAYNLVSFTEKETSIRYLYEMLEGQVAVLTSGVLPTSKVVELLDALPDSSLYRADQQSYILYPNKRLPSFLEKNNIPSEEVKRIALLDNLVKAGNKSIISKDIKGNYHFNANFNNAGFLRDALSKLKDTTTLEVTDADRIAIEALYEKVFDHQSFTGRSGTFYKYEGLGCIYWHMVSKLLLSIGENISWAMERHEDKHLIEALKKHYALVKAGIGAHKSPDAYGSFPFDPYSHTPTMAGVQQPGMTGQVKEDILSRYFELGVAVKDACICINPESVNFDEFLALENNPGTSYLSFSYCSVPFLYMNDGQKGVEIVYADNKTVYIADYQLNQFQSNEIFNRSSAIFKVIVHFDQKK